MNPNWRMWPLAVNLMSGTMAVAVSPIATYPKLTLAAGLLCYAMAAYVMLNWVRRVRYMRARGLSRS
jgi:hypothetical protein